MLHNIKYELFINFKKIFSNNLDQRQSQIESIHFQFIFLRILDQFSYESGYKFSIPSFIRVSEIIYSSQLHAYHQSSDVAHGYGDGHRCRT